METPDFSQSGDNVKQNIYGDHNLTIGHASGGVVIYFNSGDKVTSEPTERPRPIDLAPKPFPLLLGRNVEVKLAKDTLPYKDPIEFHGPSGIGKTALLRHIAHHPAIAPAFSTGRIYLRHRRYQSASDLLQVIYDTFYENLTPTKATDSNILHALAKLDVLILLDGSTLSRAEIEKLINDLPSFTFLFTSAERQLFGEGKSKCLSGLSVDDAIALIGRDLSRPLSTKEHRAAVNITAALDGNPLLVLQAIAAASEGSSSLEEIAQQVKEPQKLLTPLTKTQRRVLALLALLAGIALATEQIAEISKLPDVQSILDGLVRRRLLEVEGGRYRFVSKLVLGSEDLSSWRGRIINCFTQWAQQNTNPAQVIDEAEVLFQCLEWAVEAEQWENVVTLGCSLEKAFALSGLWDAWAQVLQWLLQAAKTIGDLALEGYVLHQLGTRSLCLNELTEAQHYLERARSIREESSDPGLDATRQNLEYIYAFLAPPPKPDPGSKEEQGEPNHNLLRNLVIFGISFLLTSLIIFLLVDGSKLPPGDPPIENPPEDPSDCNTNETISARLTINEQRVKQGETISGLVKIDCKAPEEGFDIELLLRKGGQSKKLGNVIIIPDKQRGNFSARVPGQAPTGTVDLIARHPVLEKDALQEIEIEDGTSPEYCPNENTALELIELPDAVMSGSEIKGVVTVDCADSEQDIKIQLALRSGDNNSKLPDVIIRAGKQQKNFRIKIPQDFSPGEAKIIASHQLIGDVPEDIIIKPNLPPPPSCPNSDTRLNLSLNSQEVNPGGIVNAKVTLNCSATTPINISTTSNRKGIDFADVPVIQTGNSEDEFEISISPNVSSPGQVEIEAAIQNFKNSKGSASFNITIPPTPQPDLIVQNLRTSPISLAAVGYFSGSSISVQFNVKNIGDGGALGSQDSQNSGYFVKIFLSTDKRLQPDGAKSSSTYQEDVLLGNGLFTSAPTLVPKQEKPLGPRQNILPKQIPSGDYFICAVVDPNNHINESNEDNNIFCEKSINIPQ